MQQNKKRKNILAIKKIFLFFLISVSLIFFTISALVKKAIEEFPKKYLFQETNDNGEILRISTPNFMQNGCFYILIARDGISDPEIQYLQSTVPSIILITDKKKSQQSELTWRPPHNPYSLKNKEIADMEIQNCYSEDRNIIFQIQKEEEANFETIKNKIYLQNGHTKFDPGKMYGASMLFTIVFFSGLFTFFVFLFLVLQSLLRKFLNKKSEKH